MKNRIPVVLATDDNYIYYLYVTVFSVLESSRKETLYDFWILVSDEFSESSKRKLKLLEKDYPNCRIEFVNMGKGFQQAYLSHEHITYPTYYRLLIADVLPGYDKCIYLDFDIAVCQDLSGFYRQPLGNNCLAGVRAAGYQMNAAQNRERLGLEDISGYTNAGVLLMNLKKIREDNLTQKFLELIEKKYHDQDQDILNVACYGRIKNLPLKYNLMTKYENLFEDCIKAGSYTAREIEEALRQPVIIHYADKIKPWQKPDIMFGEIWWDFARRTPFYEAILFCNLKLPPVRQVIQQNLPVQQIVQQIKCIDDNLLRELFLFRKKGWTYYRYKWLSKLTWGKKKAKYRKKFNDLKEKIKNTGKYLHPDNGKRKKKLISFKSFMEKAERSATAKGIMDIAILLRFLFHKRPKEKIGKVE